MYAYKYFIYVYITICEVRFMEAKQSPKYITVQEEVTKGILFFRLV